MNAIALADVLCTFAFGAALLFTALIPIPSRRAYMRPVKAFMVAAMALYFFVGVSNILEHGGVTQFLDVYEDYAEVLFIPLVAYLVFSISAAQRFEEVQRAEELVRGEQELLTSIIEASPTGILVVDPGGSINFANDLARDLLGLRQHDGGSRYAVPDDVRLGAQPGSVEGVTEGLLELVASAPVDDVVRYVEHPGGRIIALDVGVRSLQEGGAGRSGSVVAFVDITDRTRYRQDLERAVDTRTHELIEVNRRLAVVNDAKRDFLTRLSHEFRGPLNSILGFTGTVLQGAAGELTGEQRRQLEMVRASGSHLLNLVNDVVDIELIEAGRTPVQHEPVDACGVVRSVADLVRSLAADGGVDLETDCPDGRVMLMTDADKLSQVVRNLVSNAIKFTDVGGWVRVVTRTVDGAITIAVADSGVGIAPEDLPHVFEAFTPVKNGATGPWGGAGLGLAICRDLTVLLGGQISADSQPGMGSTFTLTFPGESVDDQRGGQRTVTEG